MSTTTQDTTQQSVAAYRFGDRLWSTTGVTAQLSIAVGFIHLWVTQEHFAEWWGYGAFFLATGLFQIIFGPVLMRRPTWRVALAGIVVNLSIVLVWVASRTTGIPLGPEDSDGIVVGEAGHPGGAEVEPVGALDLTATAMELVIIALLVTLLPRRLRTATVDGLLLIGIGLWVVRFTGALG